MSVVKELLRTEADGTISFGNYELDQKAKLSDYEHSGDLYKVKTFQEITKLERNGMMVYESVPGTAVTSFAAEGNRVSFQVFGKEEAQITLGLEEDTEYSVTVGAQELGNMKSNKGGKVTFSLTLEEGAPTAVNVKKK